jgi:hypothetical protein
MSSEDSENVWIKSGDLIQASKFSISLMLLVMEKNIVMDGILIPMDLLRDLS